MSDPLQAAGRGRSLILLAGLAKVSPLREVVPALEAVSGEDVEAAGPAYAAVLRALLDPPGGEAPGSMLERLACALLFDENGLGRAALPAEALAAARADLRSLQLVVRAAERLPEAVAGLTGGETPALPGRTDPAARSEAATEAARAAGGWADRLAESTDWAELVPALVAQYREHGAGPLARYRALRWNGAALEPVLHPDIPSPASLVGYEHERALLRRTTAQFAAGHPGNSVLLYGDRGTGKSSSVKSLLHPESADGPGWERLRLIEVPKARLVDFPAIVPRLRGRPQRFILFVDDLSFEDGETEYKHMKAMLEGGIEARPENVVVYATSNRRHLIRERFTDRTSPDSDDVHARDTVEEKLSFSDRFGITITFPSPNQTAYLEIVAGLAAQRGIPLEPAALRARAIEWAAWHNGRSGRTARQFVDYLEGELGLGAVPVAASRA